MTHSEEHHSTLKSEPEVSAFVLNSYHISQNLQCAHVSMNMSYSSTWKSVPLSTNIFELIAILIGIINCKSFDGNLFFASVNSFKNIIFRFATWNSMNESIKNIDIQSSFLTSAHFSDKRKKNVQVIGILSNKEVTKYFLAPEWKNDTDFFKCCLHLRVSLLNICSKATHIFASCE